jgi:hypothetical protein
MQSARSIRSCDTENDAAANVAVNSHQNATSVTISSLPDICIARILMQSDFATFARLERTSRRFLRVSAAYVVWESVIEREDLVEFLACPVFQTTSTSAAPAELSEMMWTVGNQPLTIFEHFETNLRFEKCTYEKLQQQGGSSYFLIGKSPEIAGLKNRFAKMIVALVVALGFWKDGLRSPRTGLYVAPYGSHGNELVYVQQDGFLLTGTKITGDRNVPAGAVTFEVLHTIGGDAMGRVSLATQQVYRGRRYGHLTMSSSDSHSISLTWINRESWQFTRVSKAVARHFHAAMLDELDGHADADVIVLAQSKLPAYVRDLFASA